MDSNSLNKIIVIGSSNENTKTINISDYKFFENQQYVIYPSCFNDKFKLEINNDVLKITRVDSTDGWGQYLKLMIVNLDLLRFKIFKTANFGDGVNHRFWTEMIGKGDIIINDNSKTHYFTTGSILNNANDNSIVFGTGFISETDDLGGCMWYGNNTKHATPSCVLAVRGPKTRQKLLNFGVNCPENYGDPLILMPCLYNKHKKVNDDIIGILPHYIDKDTPNVLKLVKSLESQGYTVNILDICVTDDYERLINSINRCKYIISSSLHGVIMGIVYAKQTIFVPFSEKVTGNHFKFYDFFESVDINYNIDINFTYTLLNNVIDVNYDKLISTGLNLIDICPFLSDGRKCTLKRNYNEFYKIAL